MSDSLHPKVMLCSRFVSFHQSLLKCSKFPVRYLARLHESDQRTVFGRTLAHIAHECDHPLPSKTLVKKKMKYCAVPNSEVWRSSLLTDLLKAKDDISTLPGFSSTEVEEMLKFVCTS